MSLESHLRSCGGITPSQHARARGWSYDAMHLAVAAGRVIRPRKGWIALPTCDPALLYAATHGVVLSCVTAAARLGLWVLDTSEQHVATRHSGAKHTASCATVHWARPLVPREPHQLQDSVVNTLGYVAACRPREQALTIWDSALNKGVVDHAMLARLPLLGAARELLDASTPFADSGLETIARSRLAWLSRYNIRVVPQAMIHGHCVDLLIGQRLVLQIDGGHHVDAQRQADNRHDAALLQRGYAVIRVGYAQVVHDWPGVHKLVTDAIAQGLHLGPQAHAVGGRSR